MEVEELKAENEKLAEILKKNKEAIRSLTRLNGILADSLANAATVEDVVDSVKVRRFDIEKNGFELSGFFEIIEPFRITFEKMIAKLNLEIALSQNKDKT
jgi:hypothetical protein